MQFHNSTPETVGDYVAMQEARRAAKRKSSHGSDSEPSTKKQKLLHDSMPPAPTQSQAIPTPLLGTTTDGEPKLVDASLPPAPTQSQAHATTGLGPRISTKKRKKYDNRSVTPAPSHDMANHGPGTQEPELDQSSCPPAHDITGLEPPTKKQKLSYASLPPSRIRVREPVEVGERREAEFYRRLFRRWCKPNGFDPDLINESTLPDKLLLSGNFDIYEFMSSQSPENHDYASGPPEIDAYPFADASAANPMAPSPEVGAYWAPRPEPQQLFHHSPALNEHAQACPVSGDVSVHHPLAQGPISRVCSGSGDETSHPSSAQNLATVISPALGGEVNEARPPLGDQTSKLLSSVSQSFEGPSCSSSDPNAGHTTTSTSSDQTILVSSVCDMADETVAGSSNQNCPLSLDVNLKDSSTPTSSNQVALVSSIRDTRDNVADTNSHQIPPSSSDVNSKDNSTPTSSDRIALVDSIRDAGDEAAIASSDQIAASYPDVSLVDNATPRSSNQITVIDSIRDAGDTTVDASQDEIAPLSLDVNLKDDNTPASLSRTHSVGPARNKGGRPRGRKPRALKPPKGPTRFQKNHPVKTTVNMDVWENILLFCPLEFLLKARSISTTFRSVLKDNSLIWKKARLHQFGPDMPDPALGLSEPQYADLVTGNGCQTGGCTSKKTRKTYWALGKRLCIECFQKSFIPPRALKRVFKEFEKSATPQYNSIAQYYRRMDQFLPAMKFDRWDNYQWLGDYESSPSWGQIYRSGQYTAYPAAAYANFNSELASFVGNEYDVESGRFSSNEPLPGKTCPSQDVIDAWFEAKHAANDALVPELQAVENWCESLKRDNQKASKDLRKSRESFYEEQAELAGWNKDALQHFKSYQAAIAISKPPSTQSWKILQPKILAECEAAKKSLAEEAEK